jgi:hypothetical protein
LGAYLQKNEKIEKNHIKNGEKLKKIEKKGPFQRVFDNF